MTGLVPDIDTEGPALALVRWLERSDLGGWWAALGLEVHTLAGLGWAPTLPDREVWHRCQRAGLVLVTDNRNHDGPGSLEATLRDAVREDSLPVVTVADKDAVVGDRRYAERVARHPLEALTDQKDRNLYRGVGRLFLPFARTT